jgi:hypothetical protein
MKSFVSKRLKTDESITRVKVNVAKNSEVLVCLRNVSEYCKKNEDAEPVLCWWLLSRNGVRRANLHAVVREDGKLRDITSHPLGNGDKTRIIVIETRLSVEQARNLTRERQQTFKDVISPPRWQEDGIDFFKVI